MLDSYRKTQVSMETASVQRAAGGGSSSNHNTIKSEM